MRLLYLSKLLFSLFKYLRYAISLTVTLTFFYRNCLNNLTVFLKVLYYFSITIYIIIIFYKSNLKLYKTTMTNYNNHLLFILIKRMKTHRKRNEREKGIITLIDSKIWVTVDKTSYSNSKNKEQLE